MAFRQVGEGIIKGATPHVQQQTDIKGKLKLLDETGKLKLKQKELEWKMMVEKIKIALSGQDIPQGIPSLLAAGVDPSKLGMELPLGPRATEVYDLKKMGLEKQIGAAEATTATAKTRGEYYQAEKDLLGGKTDTVSKNKLRDQLIKMMDLSKPGYGKTGERWDEVEYEDGKTEWKKVPEYGQRPGDPELYNYAKQMWGQIFPGEPIPEGEEVGPKPFSWGEVGRRAGRSYDTMTDDELLEIVDTNRMAFEELMKRHPSGLLNE